MCVRRSPLPVRASAFFEAAIAAIRPAARQVPPLLRASVPPLRPSARQLVFSFRASGIPHPHPRVSYYFPSARQVPPTPIRASATIPLPRVRYPPSPSAPATILPSARQVCVRRSPLPFRASAFFEAAIRPAARQVPSARQFRSYSHALVSYYFPSAHQVTPSSSARQLLYPFRASGNPHPHPRVSYYTLPRVRYPTPIRASATILPSARQVCASAFFEAAIRPAARQVPPLLRASVPLRPSAHQLLFSFCASGNPVRYPPPPSARPLRASGTHPRVSYYPPFRASGMRQALPTPGPRVSLFRSCYSPCRASGSFRASVPLLLPSPTIFLPRIR